MKYSVMLISLPTTDCNNEFINFPCYHWSLEQPAFKTLLCRLHSSCLCWPQDKRYYVWTKTGFREWELCNYLIICMVAYVLGIATHFDDELLR